MSTENNCPHHSCTRKKPYGHYACTIHWFKLPKIIQDKIYLGFKSRGIASPIWIKADIEAREHWKLIERRKAPHAPI